MKLSHRPAPRVSIVMSPYQGSRQVPAKADRGRDGGAPAACFASISAAAFSEASIPLASSAFESAIQSKPSLPMRMSTRPLRRVRSRKFSSAFENTDTPAFRPGIRTVNELPPGEPPPWLTIRSPR